MTLDDLRDTLRKMNLSEVAKDTKIHHNTLVRIKNGDTSNPSYAVVKTLIDYIESGFKARTEQ